VERIYICKVVLKKRHGCCAVACCAVRGTQAEYSYIPREFRIFFWIFLVFRSYSRYVCRQGSRASCTGLVESTLAPPLETPYPVL